MFKIISGIILFISLLTGCSKSGSYHDAPYYESHLAQASEVVKTCKAMNADFVKTLKVTGTDLDSDKSKVFDLVSNRLVENIEIEKQRINNKFFIKEKYRQLEALYLRHQPLLLKQYKI